jgi:hypothetical protein
MLKAATDFLFVALLYVLIADNELTTEGTDGAEAMAALSLAEADSFKTTAGEFFFFFLVACKSEILGGLILV